jgi:hypothetical protein
VSAAGFVVVVGGDMAAELRGSGLERGGCGGCRDELGRSGSVCHRFPDVRGGSEAGDRVVVVVDNSVDAVDGGVDVVGSGGDGDLAGISLWAVVCVTESAVEVEMVWELESTVQLSIVWVLVSIVMLAVGSVCISASIPTFWNRVPRSSHLSGPCFVSQLSRLAVLPLSSPSFTPFLYPASNCASLPPCSSSM